MSGMERSELEGGAVAGKEHVGDAAMNELAEARNERDKGSEDQDD